MTGQILTEYKHKERKGDEMKIQIVSVGKLKEKYLKEGIGEYTKRLSSYCQLEIIEVADEPAQERLSLAEGEQVKVKEGERILKQIKEDSFVFVLELQGKALSSEELAEKIDKLALAGKSHITFVIGGSLGLSNKVLSRADFRLSFSPMTFPHQLMRLILIEQIYRAFRIIKNEPYHK